jgi:hypothetical protein
MAAFYPLVVSAAPSHLQLVQALYEAFSRRNVGEILPLLSEDVVWTEPVHPLNPGSGTRRGKAGFLEWIKTGHEAEEILSLEPRQFLTDDDSVAVAGHERCRVRATGRTYETDFVHLITFRAGKVVKFQEFFDTYAAGEAFRVKVPS